MRLLLPLGLLLLLSSYDSTAQPSESVHYSEVDIRPEPIEGFEAFSDSIEYPELARRAGIEGTVIVHLLVTVDGQVTSTYDSDVYRGLVCVEDPGGQTCEMSLRAVRAARFTPGYVGDRAVPVEECFAFEYWLPEGKGNSSVPTRIRVSPCP